MIWTKSDWENEAFDASLGMDIDDRIAGQFPALSLPSCELILRTENGRYFVFDILRKKNLVLTPEEWVRQHWVNFLIQHLSYPKGLFSLEKGLKYNQLQKRTDLVVFGREGSPYLLVECKAPEIEITQKTLQQALAYNLELNAPHVILSNGLRHYVLKYLPEENKYVQIRDFPPHP